MAPNFIGCDRELAAGRAGVPQDHLAWFVIEASRRWIWRRLWRPIASTGAVGRAHDPAMMLALLLYARAIGERSSRGIERRCVEDVTTRVICANRGPDHTMAGVFGAVLGCALRLGWCGVGVVAIDGTKGEHECLAHATRDSEQIARAFLDQAAEIDALEDEQFGERRGDELPPALATREGRQRWLRDARPRLDERRAEDARPVPRSLAKRLVEAKRRLEEELEVERRANAEYEAFRARGVMKDGRRFGGPPKPYHPPDTPVGKINLTDLDSRNVKTPRGWVQGYNAQAATTEQQIVIAAEVTVDSPDFGHLEPMVKAIETDLAAAGVTVRPHVVVADAGYWHQAQMDRLINRGIGVLIPPDAGKRKGARPGWDGGFYAFMRRLLATDFGGELYAKRQGMIEPVFAHTKFNRGMDRFLRRGRAACRSEWRLITATHNLVELHRHQLATAGG